MIGLVHLVWAPLGPEPLRTFLRSYHAHPAGAEHELVVVLNGADATGLARAAVMEELGETRHRLIVLERPMLDLAAYGEVAGRLEQKWLCFLNSYSTILADDWLGHLARAVEAPGVGIAGATGSWESQSRLVNGRAWHWIFQLATLPRSWRDYPRFPNPHLRTTAFMLERQAVLDLGLERARRKYAAYLLESGRHGVTRQIQARGLRAVVVGRDGVSYGTGQWPTSGTYRSGEQENLLVADNRTREWQQASGAERRRLTRHAWGAR